MTFVLTLIELGPSGVYKIQPRGHPDPSQTVVFREKNFILRRLACDWLRRRYPRLNQYKKDWGAVWLLQVRSKHANRTASLKANKTKNSQLHRRQKKARDLVLRRHILKKGRAYLKQDAGEGGSDAEQDSEDESANSDTE